MSELLRQVAEVDDSVSFTLVAARITLSVVAGFVVAGVYYLSRTARRDDNPTLPTTLVLLTVVLHA